MKTAMQELNEWFKESHPLITTGDMVKKIAEMLEKEKKQIEGAWESGINNCGEFNTPSIATGKQYYAETFITN